MQSSCVGFNLAAMFLALGSLFFLAGVALLVGAVVVLVRGRRLRAGMASAAGTVVALHTRQWVSALGVPTKRDYLPEVEFDGPFGRVRFVSAYGSRPVGFSVGERVRVLYDAARPQTAEVDTATAKYLFPGVMSAIGCGFFFIGGTFALFGLLELALR